MGRGRIKKRQGVEKVTPTKINKKVGHKKSP